MKNRELNDSNLSEITNEPSTGATTRRDFLSMAAVGLTAGGTLLKSGETLAQAKGYAEIQPAQQVSSPEGRIEVLEYFWFGCPHCYAFEPAINEWAASRPEYVDFVREAPPLNPSWRPHSEAFYAAEQLGVTDKFFDQMFNGIHKEKRNLRNRKNIAKFAGELGIDSKEFLAAMKSFAVETRMRQSMQKAMNAGITGVPSVIIHGKYRTGNSLAGSHAGIIKVINDMVDVEYKKVS